MLTISDEQEIVLSRQYLIRKLVRFLLQRTQKTQMRLALENLDQLTAMWTPILEEFDSYTEYQLVTMLTYILTHYCERDVNTEKPFNSLALIHEIIDMPDSLVLMQRYYSDLGYLRLCEFELGDEA